MSYDYEICNSNEVICPYCQTKDQFSSDALGDDETCEERCINCGLKFEVRACFSVDHQCSKIESGEKLV